MKETKEPPTAKERKKSIDFILQCIFSAFSQHGAIYAAPILGLKQVFTTGIPTAAICPSEVLFNPEFMNTLSFPEGVFVAAHEGCHLGFLHPFRKERLFAALPPEDRSDYLFNWAADVEVNGFLVAGRVGSQPKDCVPGKTGTTAEREYLDKMDELKKEGKWNQPPPPKGQPGQPGQGQPGQPGQGEQEASDGMQDPGYGLPGKPLDHVGTPKNPDGTAMSPTELAEGEAVAKANLQAAAAQHQKQKGSLPAGMEELLDGLLESKRDWRDILAQYVSTVYCKEDWSYRKTSSRRTGGGGIVMPTLYSPMPGRVVACCDTSGSVGPDELREICGELLTLIAMYNDSGTDIPLDVIWFDTKAYHEVIYDGDELKPKGRGGTRFVAAFDKVKELDDQPEAIVFATDGYDYEFGEDPGVPVLWVMTANSDPNFSPPFGEVVVKHD